MLYVYNNNSFVLDWLVLPVSLFPFELCLLIFITCICRRAAVAVAVVTTTRGKKLRNRGMEWWIRLLVSERLWRRFQAYQHPHPRSRRSPTEATRCVRGEQGVGAAVGVGEASTRTDLGAVGVGLMTKASRRSLPSSPATHRQIFRPSP